MPLSDEIALHEVLPAFAGEGVPIVFSADACFLRYLPIAIRSVVRNSDGKLDFLILTGDVSDDDKRDFLGRVEISERVRVRFIDLQGAAEKFGMTGFMAGCGLPESSLYRLLIAEMLVNYVKVIYLDCDIVCLKDIANLYDINLDEHCFAAAVDTGIRMMLNDVKGYADYARKRGFSDWDTYVNSGVLVMNLSEMRSRGVSRLLVEDAIAHNEFLADQDAINFQCHNLIKVLDSRWNFQIAPLSSSETVFPNCLPWICHYTGRKPWNDPRVPFSHLWWSLLTLDEMMKYRAKVDFFAEEKRLGVELKVAREEADRAWKESNKAWKEADKAWESYNKIVTERDKAWEEVTTAWKAYDAVKHERDKAFQLLTSERAAYTPLWKRVGWRIKKTIASLVMNIIGGKTRSESVGP